MSSSPRIALILPIAAATLGLTSCVGIDAGPTTTEARDVGAFTRLKAEDEVDVNVRAGETRRVRVRAGEKVIDDIRTEVRGDTLYVSYDGPGVRNGRLLVEVDVPKVDAVDITGAADVRVAGLTGDALDVRVTSAGDVTAEGRVQRLSLEIGGAGDADLAALEARNARVELTGSGDADVRASALLDAEVSGAGDLTYRGNAELRDRVSGDGDIEHAG